MATVGIKGFNGTRCVLIDDVLTCSEGRQTLAVPATAL